MSNGAGSKDVLLGPRKPLWSCTKCHRKGNWASRIRCVCGCAAPVEVSRAARKAHEMAVAGGSTQQSPKGKWSQGAPQLQEALGSILKRLDSIEKG
eukprot:4054839-Pyramimonas_sp.AAC.1